MTTLFKASQQWSTRPDDEKFFTIDSAYKQAKAYADSAQEKSDVPASSLRVEAIEGEVKLVGRGGIPAKTTHWSFGQLAARAGAPAGYLRTLPATLAAQNVNHGLKNRYPVESDETVNILAHSNGELLVRSFNSDKYSRIWNHELLRRMLDFGQFGWKTPVPFENGTLGWNPCIYCKGNDMKIVERDGKRMHSTDGHNFGDTDFVECLNQPQPTIYVSDHDMFVFMVNNNFRVNEPGNPAGLGRGFFVENSEVGASKLRISTFLYRDMCSNHLIWGAKDLTEIALRHVGNVADRVGGIMDGLEVTLTRYANESVSDLEAQIKLAKTTLIAADKDKVLDKLFEKLKGSKITRNQLDRAYDSAEKNAETDGNPRSVWGMAQGITRISQEEKFADVRMGMDRAAGRLVDMAF